MTSTSIQIIKIPLLTMMLKEGFYYFLNIVFCWFKIKFDQNEATKAYLTLNLKNPF